MSDGAIRDGFGRSIQYLRVAVTDACDLRCRYCMPEDMAFYDAPHLMRDGELLRLVGLFASLGFGKVRLTGGEPTLRPGLARMLGAIRSMPGVEEVGLTTNGVRLAELAEPLRAAGLRRVNVSLDAADAEAFRRVTRRDRFRAVWRGLEAAEAAGLGIKLNCVIVRGLNDGPDVAALAGPTLDRPWQVRFIELMPIGALHAFQTERLVPEAELRARIEEVHGPLEVLRGGALDGEARVYRLAGARGEVGFISPVSQPFCSQCGRVRLMANGILRLCLLRDDEANLLEPLRAGAGDDDLRQLIVAAVRRKPWGHEVHEGRYATNRTASQIGG